MLEVAWRLAVVYDPGDPSAGSWLDGQVDETTGKFGLGCITCCAAGFENKFAKYRVGFASAQLQNFKNHASSGLHRRGLAIAKGMNPEELDVNRAPPTEHFEKVLRAARESHGYATKADGVGKSKKQQALRLGGGKQ